MAKDKASSKVIDFSNVKEGGNFNKARVPAGDYQAKIIKVADAESKSDQVFQYLFTIKLTKHGSRSYPYYCKLQENQLWKLRNLAIACGVNVPKSRTKFDANKLVGKFIGVTMEDDEYEGKEQSNIAAVFPQSELTEGSVTNDDDQDDSADDVDDEDDEADAGDQFDDMDRAALKKFLKAADDAAVFKKSETDDDLRTRARAVSGADEEEDDEEEPAPKAKKKAKKGKKTDENEMDISDL